MSSADNGVTWETSVPADVDKVKTLTTYKQAKEVPVNGDSNLNLANPHTSYQADGYGATNVGLKHFNIVWTTVFSWSDCCP
jgi:hypothetical protein